MVNQRTNALVAWFHKESENFEKELGGKNASLAKMIQKLSKSGIKVPGGYATTATAYRQFIEENNMHAELTKIIESYRQKKLTLATAGKKIRDRILKGKFSNEMVEAILGAFQKLKKENSKRGFSVAVRSSATAEDLPGASFAGQLESYLNIASEERLLSSVKECYASLFTDRAIAYREQKGFDHMQVALSVGIQVMVRSDKASSGVMFSIDPESGFEKVVVIEGAWGLGEAVVQGIVNPDHFVVYKPLLDSKKVTPILEKKCGTKEIKIIYSKKKGRETEQIKTSDKERSRLVLSDKELLQLANWATKVEQFYGCPMDMEWAKDADTQELFLVQARPETVHSQEKKKSILHTFHLKSSPKPILRGMAIGNKIVTGRVCRLNNPTHSEDFKKGDILVTKGTNPDWVPIMKKAGAIVTDQGSRTSHAAIVSRELGLPAIVGSGKATSILKNQQQITISCAEGEEGRIYEGVIPFTTEDIYLDELPSTKTQVMMNIASPEAAFRWWNLPVQGVGLARIEFIINNSIKIHPNALLNFKQIKDKKLKKTIAELTASYSDKRHYYIENLALGIAKIAAVHYPKDVIVRFSDFKTNEYAGLIGGAEYEGQEANPMLGFRGAFRYYHEGFKQAFAMECEALKYVREKIGLDNVIPMIPFCRTIREADNVLKIMQKYGLRRGQKSLQVYMMTEIPANIFLARDFAERFDGFSIGSNDLTQLILGVDRDSQVLEPVFDENDLAVRKAIREVIAVAKDTGTKIGICGQAPSDSEEFLEFLIQEGIDSISLNVDSVIEGIKKVAAMEGKMQKSKRAA